MRRLAAVLGAFGLTLATACGTGDDDGSEADVESSGDSGELVIDGELIADAETWQAAQDEGKITLYMANPEDAWRPVMEQFTEDTGIEVEIVRLVSAQLYERVLSEQQAGQLAADVVEMGEDSLVADLREQGVFQEHEVPNAADIPEELMDEDRLTVVGSRNSMALAYNSAVIDEGDAPRTWEDLLDPAWENNLGITYIGIGGSALSVAMLQRDLYGDEYWDDLAAQNPTITESVVPLTEEIVRGEIPLGVTATAVVLGHMDQDAPIQLVFPEEAVPAFAIHMGIPEGAANPNAAKVYLNWRLALRGSQTAFEITGEFPSHPDVQPVEIAGFEVPTPEDANVFTVTEEMMEGRDERVAEWNATFGYSE